MQNIELVVKHNGGCFDDELFCLWAMPACFHNKNIKLVSGVILTTDDDQLPTFLPSIPSPPYHISHWIYSVKE